MELDLSQIYAILTAAVLGAGIGLERELSQKAAGLRTNTLICIGACLFTIVSKKMGLQFGDSPARIAAGIVGGVGFLGAGAIIQSTNSIQGVTTAATIWLVASIGISCGAGFYLLAIFTSLLATLTLLGFRPIERKVRKRRNKKQDTKTE